MTAAGHRARKRFGQHWLVDETVLDRIVTAAELAPGERVLEVGPGRGALSERLLASPLQSLVAVELDRDLVAGLRQRQLDASFRGPRYATHGIEKPLPLSDGCRDRRTQSSSRRWRRQRCWTICAAVLGIPVQRFPSQELSEK